MQGLRLFEEVQRSWYGLDRIVSAAEESAVQSKIAREKVRRAAVQYVPATAVLRALEVEKRVRDAAAAITVNRRATESI